MESLKGYLLMARPKNSTTGTVINTPLSKDETFRIGPHGHNVTVTDNGHRHDISDPGHSHSVETKGHEHSCYDPHVQNCWIDTATGSTGPSRTNVGVVATKSNINMAVQTTGASITSEGYPLAYVLLCQRVSPFRASSASPASLNGCPGCPGGSLSACADRCPSSATAFTACIETCSSRCSSKAALAAQK